MELEIDQGYAGGFSPDADISTPNSKHDGMGTPHTHDSGMGEDTNVQDDYYCEIFQNQIKKHWIDLKRQINPKTLSERLAKIGWTTRTDMGNNKRSIDAEKLLNEVTPKLISKSRIEQFKNAVGEKIIGILESPSKSPEDHLHFAESTDKDKDRLQKCKILLEETLLPKHIQEIKDNFLQCDIIDWEENNELCLNPGLYSSMNKAIVRQFVDLAIEKAHLGSYQCIVESIKTLNKNDTNRRLGNLLLKLESDDKDKKCNSDYEKGNKKTVKVSIEKIFTSPCQKELEDSDEDITADIIIKFNKDNEKTRKLYDVIKDQTLSHLRTFAASNLGLECTNVEKGSVIIHLKSLDGKLRSRLRNSMYNREMEKLLEVIFTNAEVNSLLTPGNFCLEMEVRAVKAVKPVKVKENILTHHWDIVADNKSFLVEEIDTEVIAEAFERYGKYFSDKWLQADRYNAAKLIIEEIIQKHWQQTFREVLIKNGLTFIQQRLITYERVCRADTTYLRQNILTQFPLLLSNIDLNEMRCIFTERGILKKQLFDKIEKKYGDDRKKANANFVIEVLQSGSDAMLTFIDALFVLQLDEFANCLLKSKPKDVVCMTENADLEGIFIKWSDNSGEDVIIKGSFSLVVNHAELMKTPVSIPVTGTGKRKRTHSSDKFRQATFNDGKYTRDNRKRDNVILMNCSDIKQSFKSRSEPSLRSCVKNSQAINMDDDIFNISQFADLSLKDPDSDHCSLRRVGSYQNNFASISEVCVNNNTHDQNVKQMKIENLHTHYIASFGRKCHSRAQSHNPLSSSYDYSSDTDFKKSRRYSDGDFATRKSFPGTHTENAHKRPVFNELMLMMYEEDLRRTQVAGQHLPITDWVDNIPKTDVTENSNNQGESALKRGRMSDLTDYIYTFPTTEFIRDRGNQVSGRHARQIENFDKRYQGSRSFMKATTMENMSQTIDTNLTAGENKTNKGHKTNVFNYMLKKDMTQENCHDSQGPLGQYQSNIEQSIVFGEKNARFCKGRATSSSNVSMWFQSSLCRNSTRSRDMPEPTLYNLSGPT